MTTSPTAAIGALESLVQDRVQARQLDEQHDTMRLMGIVLSLQALLDVVTQPTTEKNAAAKVSAAKILLATKETPETIAERLRRSPLAGLTTQQLQAIVEKMKSGTVDLASAINHSKESPNGRT
jgi:hypothetical protein